MDNSYFFNEILVFIINDLHIYNIIKLMYIIFNKKTLPLATSLLMRCALARAGQ